MFSRAQRAGPRAWAQLQAWARQAQDLELALARDNSLGALAVIVVDKRNEDALAVAPLGFLEDRGGLLGGGMGFLPSPMMHASTGAAAMKVKAFSHSSYFRPNMRKPPERSGLPVASLLMTGIVNYWRRVGLLMSAHAMSHAQQQTSSPLLLSLKHFGARNLVITVLTVVGGNSLKSSSACGSPGGPASSAASAASAAGIWV